MTRILVTDDEAPARRRLKALLEDLGEPWEWVGEAGNGGEALVLAEQMRPDIVLLDISMPGMDGLTATAQLAALEPPPAIILVTAHDEHALQAFQQGAIDYLLKPVSTQRLQQALERATTPNRAQRSPHKAHSLPVRRHDGLRLIPLGDIHYLQADSKYTAIHHSGGVDLIEQSLAHLEQQHGERFTRIHRATLVANDRIRALRKVDEHWVVELDGVERALPVSRRNVAELRQQLLATPAD